MATASKARQPRLRASCDGCFLAKVKCSKARPICSRCLACGIECRYSPSSRAGKPKSESRGSSPRSSSHDVTGVRSVGVDKNIAYNTSHMHQPPEHLFRVNAGWTTPPTSVDGSASRHPSMSHGLAMLAVEDRAMNEHDHMSTTPDMYVSTMPWTPPTDLSAPFADGVSASQMSASHARSLSFDMAMPTTMAWTDPSAHDMMAYAQVPTPASMASNYFPSPTTTPTIRHASSRHKSPSMANMGSCTCFTVCLQSLQALQSSPASPPFDLVLSLNQKAVEGCAAMLACPKCMSRTGSHTSAMLLATVMGKITSFYRNASQSFFDSGALGMNHNSPGNPLGVSLGTYQLNGEDGRWLELEILARELRKLEEVYTRFREVCGDLSDDADVSRALIGYLGQNLGTMLEVVSHRRGDMTFA
jgi:hypothetical protein